MNEMYAELLAELGLIFDEETTEYTLLDETSVKAALSQFQICQETDWTEDDIETVFGFLYTVDRLNEKFLRNYDVEVADPNIVAGLQVSYERALGSVCYGFLQQFYTLFSRKPKVFHAVFGPKLGRMLLDHSLQMKPEYETLERLRTQWQDAPTSFHELLEQELMEINEKQKALALALGLSEESIDSAMRYLFAYHFHAEEIDFDKLDNEIGSSSSQTIKRRLADGRERFPSEEYMLANKLSNIQDKEKRNMLHDALQAAKDKDRVQAGRMKEEASLVDKDTLGKSKQANTE